MSNKTLIVIGFIVLIIVMFITLLYIIFHNEFKKYSGGSYDISKFNESKQYIDIFNDKIDVIFDTMLNDNSHFKIGFTEERIKQNIVNSFDEDKYIKFREYLRNIKDLDTISEKDEINYDTETKTLSINNLGDIFYDGFAKFRNKKYRI